MKKLLFITWSISYGYGTEKSLADVLNRMDKEKYEISILPLFKNSESTLFHDNITILDSLIDYTAENFDEKKRWMNITGFWQIRWHLINGSENGMTVSSPATTTLLPISLPTFRVAQKSCGSGAI